MLREFNRAWRTPHFEPPISHIEAEDHLLEKSSSVTRQMFVTIQQSAEYQHPSRIILNPSMEPRTNNKRAY